MNKEKENKNAEISARIAEIIEFKGESRNSFAVKLGYERAQTVYDIINMKSAPSYDFFRRFSISEFSDTINTDWLLSGRGSMLRDNQDRPQHQKPTQSEPSSGEATAYYKMYEKKDAEVGSLKEEIGALKLRISQLEAGNIGGKKTAKDASIKKSSSPNTDNATSATAP